MRPVSICSVALLTAAVLLSACAGRNTTAPSPDKIGNMTFAEIPTLNNDQAVVYNDVTPDYVLTYAENQTEDYPTTQAGYRFAQLVNLGARGKFRFVCTRMLLSAMKCQPLRSCGSAALILNVCPCLRSPNIMRRALF